MVFIAFINMFSLLLFVGVKLNRGNYWPIVPAPNECGMLGRGN
jgi:hypothetical protein